MVREPPPSPVLAFEALISHSAGLCLSALSSQWLPHALLHWQALLFKQTHRLLLLVPDVVGRDRTLSLVSMADNCARAVLPKVPVAGKAMLTSYNEWVADAVETAEYDQQHLIDAGKSSLPLAIHHGNAPLTTGSPRSLQAVCEYYLYRNDGLQRVNKSLVAHISSLESDLQQAQTSLFDAQCIISRIKEVEEVRAKRLRVTPAVFRALGQQDPRFTEQKKESQLVQPEDSVEAHAQHDHLMNDPVTRVKAENAAEGELRDDLKKIGTVWISNSDDETEDPYDSQEERRVVERTDVDNSVLHESTDGRPHAFEVDALRTAMAFTTTPNNFNKLTTAEPPNVSQEARAIDCTNVDGSAPRESTSERPRIAEVDVQDTTPYDPDEATNDADGDSTNFSQLLELDGPKAEEADGDGDEDSWHRRALRRLAKEREQRRRRSRSQSLTSSSPQHSRSSFASSVETDSSLPRSSVTTEDQDADADDEEEPEAPLDFQSLVALRASDDVHSTAEWQHRALHCLTKERERLPQCHRLRSASVSPTNSSTSPLTFLYA